jgi:hypothetical protein
MAQPGAGSVRLLGRRRTHDELGWVVVSVATIVFAVVFWRSSLAMHSRFLTNSFDLGIFSQGLYLLSRFEDPFVTLRGLHLFADHSSYIMLLMVPLYWLWADVRMLLLFGVALLAAGAPIVYGAGRRLGITPVLAAAAAIAYLLHPALWWAVWDTFHPEFVAIPLLLATFSLLATHRTGWAMATFVGVLLVKEDAALVAVPFALFAGWYFGTWRWACRAAVVGLAAFGLNIVVLLPALSPTGELFRVGRYALEGRRIEGGLGALVWEPVTHPLALVRTLGSGSRITYLLQMLGPAPLGIRAPDVLLVAVPVTIANMLAIQVYQHQIQYHYTAYLLAIVSLATLVALRRIQPVTSGPRSWVVGSLLVGAALLGGLIAGPDLTAGDFGVDHPDQQVIHEALALIPPDAAVSAESHIAAHLAERAVVYTWHNPFGSTYWGVGDPPHDPAEIEQLDYVVLQPSRIDPASDSGKVYQQLLDSPDWTVRVSNAAVILLEQTR